MDTLLVQRKGLQFYIKEIGRKKGNLKSSSGKAVRKNFLKATGIIKINYAIHQQIETNVIHP